MGLFNRRKPDPSADFGALTHGTYDARPDLDLVGQGLDGRPVIVNLRKWCAKRAALLERVEALFAERQA